ncbi:MAG: hypothetical protein WA988_00500 [Candidatus Nanopelagicales bacterium]
MTSTVAEVFALAAKRLTIVANKATPGPWLRSKTVPGALRCEDAPDGGEMHLAFGIARGEAFRLMVGADPEPVRLLASVFAAADPDDAATPALTDLAVYLNQKMRLQLPDAEPPVTRHPVVSSSVIDAADL